MNKIILPAIVALVFAVPGVALANNSSQLPESCSVDDIQLQSTPEGFVNVVACSGAIEGNDSKADNWLENENVWADNGDNDLLTNVNGGTTDQSWIYLTKYSPDGSVEPGEPNIDDIFSVVFSDCSDKDGVAVPCGSNDSVNVTVDINFNTNATELLYNQFVFSAVAGKYFSLYQVQVLEGIESISGTLSMVSKQGLSHLSVYASTYDAPSPKVEVNAPATAGLLLTGLVALRLRRK